MARDKKDGLGGLVAPGDMGGEYEAPEASGTDMDSASDVAAFVDAEIGLEVLQAFGKKSVGRRATKPPLYFEFSRELTVDDALLMQQAPARKVGETGGTPALQRIRTIHHQIARMLVDGMKQVEISAILGVTVARIQQLKNDPAFMELLAHYEATEAQARIDLQHRFRLLGVVGMEELQERLLSEPDSFGNGHLMELVKLTIGGEAPKTSANPSTTTGLPPEELERMKQQADATSRGRITYRQPGSDIDGKVEKAEKD